VTTIKKPGIPAVPNSDVATYNLLASLKETVEIMTGVRGDPLKPLASTATTTQIILKINEIVSRLNAS
jgi:hypothetical protein